MSSQSLKLDQEKDVPKDWEFLKIQSMLEQNIILDHIDGNHGELYPRSDEFKDVGIPYVGANDFVKGEINFNKCKFLSEERAKQFKKGIAHNGDVLFAHNATVGPTALLKTDYDFIILSTTATYFRCNEKKLNNNFLQYSLQANYFVNQYKAVMSQSTRFQVPITTQRKFSLLLPPISEQKNISKILSDVYFLIFSLREIIRKRKNLKQGVIQELLTRKRRLEGFTREWKMQTLGEICKFTQGVQIPYHKTYSKKKINSIRYLYINDFESDKNKKFVENEYPNKVVTENDVVMANTGHTSGKSFKGKLGVLSNNAFKITFKKDILIRDFLYEFLQSDLFKIQKRKNFNSTGQPHVGHENIAKVTIPLPPIDEQQKMVLIFSDINEEIKKLETKRDKYIMIKNGMMQKLLTGEIRLT
jgi:type I restriction enzyme, S subunit